MHFILSHIIIGDAYYSVHFALTSYFPLNTRGENNLVKTENPIEPNRINNSVRFQNNLVWFLVGQ